MDNTVQEARIHSNDLSNVATAAAAASIHLNTITSNNSHNNITNANIQVHSHSMQGEGGCSTELTRFCYVLLCYVRYQLVSV